MEVLSSERADEVLVILRWRDKDAFDLQIHSEEFCTPSALAVPRLMVTAVKCIGGDATLRPCASGATRRAYDAIDKRVGLSGISYNIHTNSANLDTRDDTMK